ncbi:MAG TPA: hypothetical protein VN947_31000 [Polyangia bacterium]|nr:hypothetical protein [Polyangia bacterium]
MLKSAALLVMLVATPALAQQGATARTDFATLKKLFVQAESALTTRSPNDVALGLAQVNLSDEIAQALRAPRENRLKVSPR